MDSNTIIERIKDVGLLQSDSAGDWETLTSKFPYFSSAQWLKYGHDYLHTEGDLKKVFLHKAEPIEFARFVDRLKSITFVEEEKAVEEIQEVTIEIQNTTPVEDSSNENLIEVVVSEPPIPSQVSNIENKGDEVETIEERHSYASFVEEIRDYSSTPHEEKHEDILEMISELPNSSPFDIPVLIVENKDTLEPHTAGQKESMLTSGDSNNSNDSLTKDQEEDKSLMVMMSFTDWLNHFKEKTASEKSEIKEKKALKTAWQKEKLAEAADEEIDEIPEPIFKQAMESISMESSLISESLAEILALQGKKENAIAMYKKLSLRNPEKSTYFADRIDKLNLNFE